MGGSSRAEEAGNEPTGDGRDVPLSTPRLFLPPPLLDAPNLVDGVQDCPAAADVPRLRG